MNLNNRCPFVCKYSRQMSRTIDYTATILKMAFCLEIFSSDVLLFKNILIRCLVLPIILIQMSWAFVNSSKDGKIFLCIFVRCPLLRHIFKRCRCFRWSFQNISQEVTLIFINFGKIFGKFCRISHKFLVSFRQ